MYNILEARIERNANQVQRVTVLVEISKGDVRAIYATNNPRGGYKFLMPNEKVSEELLQEVAATGMETVDRDEIFPDWKKKYYSNH